MVEHLVDTLTKSIARTGEILTGSSAHLETKNAVREVVSRIRQPDMALVLFFVSPDYDLDQVARSFEAALPDTHVVGCTTAGEITPAGYAEGTITAISFPASNFAAKCALIENVREIGIARCSDMARDLVAGFERRDGWHMLALQFTDGLSLREDALIAALDSGLSPVPLFGGSAGDGLCFENTFVFHGGRFHADAAILILLQTDFEFSDLTFDHFTPTDKKMVVTGANPENRLVTEINGAPAAEEYARIIGQPVEKLGPFLFATYPTLVRAGGKYHVRSIQSVEDGTSLKFLSAIDVGLVLTIGNALEIECEMRSAFSELKIAGRKPALVLGFDCILRKIEIVTLGKKDAISDMLSTNNVVGFSTYGEQHNGMHVNQTFVGVAFFEPGQPDD